MKFNEIEIKREWISSEKKKKSITPLLVATGVGMTVATPPADVSVTTPPFVCSWLEAIETTLVGMATCWTPPPGRCMANSRRCPCGGKLNLACDWLFWGCKIRNVRGAFGPRITGCIIPAAGSIGGSTTPLLLPFTTILSFNRNRIELNRVESSIIIKIRIRKINK